MNINAALERMLAGRWVAGYYPEDAIERTKSFNSKNISTIINFLGENLSKTIETKEAVNVYKSLIKEIKEQKLDACISLKPTQIGLDISYKSMLSNYLGIARAAKARNIQVWLDMEAPQYVDATIRAYKSAVRLGNTGICIQSYLKRSAGDIHGLIEAGAKIRLVKGAYRAGPGAAFDSKRAINHNYIELMKLLFEKSGDFTIATHDSRIIEQGMRLNRKYKRRVTYAMLNGIRNSYAKYLARRGERVAAYVPFGRDWIGYGYRRLAEQGHLTLIIRSLFEEQRI